MPKFRKKPVEIEAWQTPPHMGNPIEKREAISSAPAWASPVLDWNVRGLTVKTLEGTMQASPGDWLIRGVQGEVYPIKNEIFLETYEPVGDHGS